MPTLLQTDTQTGPAGVDETADPRVYFDPPLWLQRRTWILNQLRKERIESVRPYLTDVYIAEPLTLLSVR